MRRTTKRAPKQLRHPRAVYRRRRVFAALVLLNLVEQVARTPAETVAPKIGVPDGVVSVPLML